MLWVCRSSAERSKIPRLSRQIKDLQKNHVVMRLRHVAAEMEHGQRKVMKLISVTSFSQRVFNSGWVLVTTIRRVSVKMMVTAFAFNLYQLCTLKKANVV